jgi:hypothetical protein
MDADNKERLKMTPLKYAKTFGLAISPIVEIHIKVESQVDKRTLDAWASRAKWDLL